MAAKKSDSTIAFLSVFLTIQAALPWILLWLADVFVFDIPAWSVQAVAGSSLVMTLVAGLMCLLPSRRRKAASFPMAGGAL